MNKNANDEDLDISADNPFSAKRFPMRKTYSYLELARCYQKEKKFIITIIRMFNKITGQSLDENNIQSIKPICERLIDGYTLNEIYAVVNFRSSLILESEIYGKPNLSYILNWKAFPDYVKKHQDVIEIANKEFGIQKYNP